MDNTGDQPRPYVWLEDYRDKDKPADDRRGRNGYIAALKGI